MNNFKTYASYLLAFGLGVMVMYILPGGEPKVISNPKFEAHAKELIVIIDSLEVLVTAKETTIDSIGVILSNDSVIINSKQIDRYEEVTFIRNASVSDNAAWLTNRYR